MENRETKKSGGDALIWVIVAVLVLLNWLLLIAAKGMGLLDLSWATVWLGIVWIPAFTLMVATIIVLTLIVIAGVKNSMRERKVDKRVRAHAKAIGVWDKPQTLGGRALELSAWENFKIRRRNGESDADLRRRCMMRADIERFKTAQEGGKGNV